MDALLVKIGIFVVLFSIGWVIGRSVERKHLKALQQREQDMAHIRLYTDRFATRDTAGQMISANVVISHDYFKFVIANIQNMLGGRLTSYESVVERARREAVLRLKEQAQEMGATEILGLRLSTTELGMQGGMVEVFAYGTAIKH